MSPIAPVGRDVSYPIGIADTNVKGNRQQDIEEEEPTKSTPPTPESKINPNVYFAEPFSNPANYKKRWIVSQAKKDGVDEAIAKYEGKWSFEEPDDSALKGDYGLVLKSKAKHHAISTKLDKVFEFEGKPFIVQYEVRFKNGIECGGAYVKLLSKNNKMDLKHFHDKTPYTIMFGPDKCGMDHKLHFIFRHKNPKTGAFEEKHAKKPSSNIDAYFSDKKTHLFTLIVNPDNTFEVYIDQNLVNSGSLLEDVSPPVNPPKEIQDVNDKKPDDWDEREKIPDPDAEKPDDWDETQPEKIEDPDAVKPSDWLDDENELISDPDAEKPEDWDEDMDGEWEAPMISNPKCKEVSGCGEWKVPMIKNPLYKGKWKPPQIENPNYKGVWKARLIPNPDYFEDLQPYKMTPVAALGLELWSMTEDIIFDNFLVTDDKAIADEWAADTWEVKQSEERALIASGKSLVDAVVDVTKDRPWLWAVFLIVIVLPIVLIIAYCCFSGSKPEDIAAAHKKTDKSSPDDVAEDETGEGTEEGGEDVDASGDASGSAKKKKSSKAQLEENLEDNEEDNEGDEEDEAEEQTVSGSPKKSPRRRKARKD
ncbi:calnexin-like [Liolophura sinensis]|uniref:calnexin-like n=1 Tax=Liolophura sinensis TaxID=3198878 RepID=UPI003158AAD1